MLANFVKTSVDVYRNPNSPKLIVQCLEAYETINCRPLRLCNTALQRAALSLHHQPSSYRINEELFTGFSELCISGPPSIAALFAHCHLQDTTAKLSSSYRSSIPKIVLGNPEIQFLMFLLNLACEVYDAIVLYMS